MRAGRERVKVTKTRTALMTPAVRGHSPRSRSCATLDMVGVERMRDSEMREKEMMRAPLRRKMREVRR